MSAAIDLCRELSTLGVALQAHGDRLRYRAPAGAMTPHLLGLLAAHKANLLAVARALDEACRLAGVNPATLPDLLRADLLATGEHDPEYLAAVIRSDVEWEGWDGRDLRLADYAPGGRHYPAKR